MTRASPLRGFHGWLVYRLVANYWALTMLAVLAAPIVALTALWVGDAGLDYWLLSQGLVLIANGDAAQEVTSISVSIDAAFIALYFSITLIVLTLATGNLGVRLVDRWLDKPMVRVSMSGLSFCLVYSLIILASLEADAPLAEQPVAALWLLLALQLLNLAMLSYALHDLGRTMFVDRSIAHLGAEASSVDIAVKGINPIESDWAHTLRAPREGYIEGINLKKLHKMLPANAGRVRFCAAPGQHVLEGEPIARFAENQSSARPSDERLLKHIAIGDTRSSAQSTVFQVRLLVEIAARAMSPGINDFYTALACADRLAHALASQAHNWVNDSEIPTYGAAPHFELPGQDLRGIFKNPLGSFRQSAADYPTVTIRMIGNYERVLDRLQHSSDVAPPPELVQFIAAMARDLADHALGQDPFAPDARDIAGHINSLEQHPLLVTSLKQVRAL